MNSQKNKFSDISNLATKTTLTTVVKKIPNVNNIVRKKQTITLKLQKLKINLIIIMTNILQLQILIL